MNAFQRRLLALWEGHAADWEALTPSIARGTGLRVWNPQLYGLPLYRRFAEEHLPPARGPLVALGLNPGKYGMSQTGIPFTDVTRASSIGIPLEPPGIAPPSLQPFLKSYRVERSAASVWALLAELWDTPENGWKELWAVAPCGLLFLEKDGTNVTPADPRLARRDDVRALRLRVIEEALETARPRGVLLLGGDVARVARDVVPEELALVVDHPVARGPGRRGPSWWAQTVAAQVRARGWA